jgi:hypothetical protein
MDQKGSANCADNEVRMMDGDLKRKLMGSILLPTEVRTLEMKRSGLQRRQLMLRFAIVLIAVFLFVWGILYVVP